MIDLENIRRVAAERHQRNATQVVDMLFEHFDLGKLEDVFDPDLAEIYRRVLPQYAALCKTNQLRHLSDGERAELAVCYASLYPSFGDQGTVAVGAAWLATRPNRQARGS